MPELPPPDGPAVHRTGGRDGRASARRPQVDGGLRSRLLWISVLPAAVVALVGAATVGHVLTVSTGPVSTTTTVLLIWAGVGCAVVLILAFVGANGLARGVHRGVEALRSSTAHGRAEMERLIQQLRRGERPAPPAEVRAVAGADTFALLAQELNQTQLAAMSAVVQASSLTPAGTAGHQVDVFVNLARRLQSLVHREIQLLDDLENEVEDPDLLKGLFQVDHLATRIRRHAENLAVLGGAVSRRQWSRPVALTEVLRSAIAEVEHYSRVKMVPPAEGTLRGHAVADVIHLVAELIENATMFSAPHTPVLLRAQVVTAGLAVEVEDRGLGMALAEQGRVNRLLADPERIDLGEMLRDGRIGLFVVSAIARRHGITVRLQTNIYGGVQAIVILPPGLLGAPETREARQPTPAQQRPAPQVGEVAHRAPAPVLAAHAPAAIPAGPPTPSHLAVDVPVPAAGHGDDPGRAAQPDVPEFRYRQVASAAGGGIDPQGAHDVRPQLPRRRSQTNLPPQLHQVPAVRAKEEAIDHDPNLMAAFMRGVTRAETAPDEQDWPPGDPDRTS